ncbi:TetR/AcrR family transcriptional regulator [Actinophytocola xanthii]|uniref:TetR family transcriptional regulator n=1 Tax=Actinophytocola xanthii TaxID=1912961 RepID=A0A1Q8CQ72_9PSEU|nr:TetR/AcrR family transcriptional regulator [Actinophytocola xanthii]OLF16495.1 TetR family transcriptional regulator [Actinophytocola xanthii]
MVTRVETAAATRRALVDAAGALLDAGGPDAVTLREVGARAGVSRSAPYRHFADKESLLAAVATEAWSEVGDALEALVAEPAARPEQALRQALLAMVEIGRTRPHLYRLMFAAPAADPTVVVRAAERTQDLFLEIVAAVVGQGAARQYGGLLLSSAHGVTHLEISGHLLEHKWQATGEQLVDLLIGLLPMD